LALEVEQVLKGNLPFFLQLQARVVAAEILFPVVLEVLVVQVVVAQQEILLTQEQAAQVIPQPLPLLKEIMVVMVQLQPEEVVVEAEVLEVQVVMGPHQSAVQVA
jgi:hypothetical protein